MKEKLKLEAFYPHPPARVWRALTDPAALAAWLMPASFEPKLGLRFRFDGLGRGKAAKVEGTILEIEAERRLTYTWDDGEDDAPGIVCWTLQPTDGGTRVTLEHQAPERVEPYVLIEAGLNWRYAMYASLPVLLSMMRHMEMAPRVPIVYVAEDELVESVTKRRAGFRQEEATCNS